ncbi:class I SAM-dependent methyltransferase [Pseudonocardia sp.]|uniref:class I SAM-dependent methyltransferase n=1 Tax=Pseudonocardia sp. TaxID=60912 RepID=UPI0031FC3A33
MLPPGLVTWIDNFTATHAWSHNEHYHHWILHQLPPTMRRALDVGCGTGDLVRTLGRRAAIVEGIDCDPTMIVQARHSSPVSERTTFTVASLVDLDVRQHYDAITAVAVLHHVPFEDALRRLANAVVPGGRLLVVGCYKEDSLSDHALSLAAVPANLAVGLYKSRGHRVPPPSSMCAPTAPATMTLAAIRETAERVLPGFHLRRGLFWRYLLRYTAPGR